MFLIREGYYSCKGRGFLHKRLVSKEMEEVLDKELEPAKKNQVMIFDLKEHYLVV